MSSTEAAVAAASARWFDAQGRDHSHVAAELKRAFRQIHELLLVSTCLCDQPRSAHDAVLAAVLADMEMGLLWFLADHVSGPHVLGVGPGEAALDHLVRAHETLSLAVRMLDH